MSNALERGLDVLEFLAARPSTRVTEVMEMLGVSRATAFRILVTLEGRGYAVHNAEAHAWHLGPSVGSLASSLDTGSIVTVAAPALTELHRLTSETVNLAVVRRNGIYWGSVLEGTHPLRLRTTVGESVPPHATAVGKAILSTLDESEWPKLLPPEPYPMITPNTRTTFDELAPEIRICRDRGWALDEEESELSGVCVAAPIVSQDGRPVAAISVSSVAGRMPRETRESFGESVVRWCDQISAELS